MTARPPAKRDPPDEEEEIEVLEEELTVVDADAPHIIVSSSIVPSGHPDYLVLTGQADPDIDSMIEDVFAKNALPDEDHPTDRPSPPIEDPDDAEFRAFMDSIAKHKLRKP